MYSSKLEKKKKKEFLPIKTRENRQRFIQRCVDWARIRRQNKKFCSSKKYTKDVLSKVQSRITSAVKNKNKIKDIHVYHSNMVLFAPRGQKATIIFESSPVQQEVTLEKTLCSLLCSFFFKKMVASSS